MFTSLEVKYIAKESDLDIIFIIVEYFINPKKKYYLPTYLGSKYRIVDSEKHN